MCQHEGAHLVNIIYAEGIRREDMLLENDGQQVRSHSVGIVRCFKRGSKLKQHLATAFQAICNQLGHPLVRQGMAPDGFVEVS